MRVTGTKKILSTVIKPRGLVTAAAALAAVLALCAVFTYAAAPGSGGDPIALKSYVDAQIAALEQRLGAPSQSASSEADRAADVAALKLTVDNLLNRVEALTADNDTLRRTLVRLAASVGVPADIQAAGGTPAAAPGTDDDAYGVAGTDGTGVLPHIPVPVQTGGFAVVELLADQRVALGAGSGMIMRTGRALAVRGEFGGLLDLTAAADLEAGAAVPLNRLLISARDDSRGVRITESAYVMIFGNYTLR